MLNAFPVPYYMKDHSTATAELQFFRPKKSAKKDFWRHVSPTPTLAPDLATIHSSLRTLLYFMNITARIEANAKHLYSLKSKVAILAVIGEGHPRSS